MIKNISKKQEKIQKKIQKQQDLNDKDCRELTDEELDQIVGGMKAVHGAQMSYVAQYVVAEAVPGVVTAKVVATDEAAAKAR